MSGRTYFISGASSGLGREMARQLTARGDDVAVAARRARLLQELADEVASHPGAVSIHELDVTDADAVARVIREADDALEGLDVVVVNAGRGGGAPVGMGGFETNRALIDVNLIGALAQADAAMELFRERGRGHLVLMSSMAANRGLPGSSTVYSATKAALASIGRSLRTETGGTPIRVTTVRPGYIRTPLTHRNRSPLVTPLTTGVRAIIEAIDEEKADVSVPTWPWRPIGVLIRLVPDRLLRRFV